MGGLYFFMAGAFFQMSLGAPADYYASKYDHIDVETILNNRRMVNYYAACLLSKGPCPPEGLEFKRILPEALRTSCIRCTEKQKTTTLRTIKRLQKEYPKIWAQLQAQWDPDDIFLRKFEETFDRPSPIETSSSTLPSSPIVPLANRFAEGTGDKTSGSSINSIQQETTRTSTTTSKSPSSTFIVSSSTSTSSPSSTKKPLSSSSSSSSSVSSTVLVPNKAVVGGSGSIFFNAPPINLPDIGANIEATVSFGTNVVGEIVKGIGALGTKALETGAVIADAVLKNISVSKHAQIQF